MYPSRLQLLCVAEELDQSEIVGGVKEGKHERESVSATCFAVSERDIMLKATRTQKNWLVLNQALIFGEQFYATAWSPAKQPPVYGS